MTINLALPMKQLQMPTKPFLIFCTLLAVTAQPMLGMQATPAQSGFYSTHKKAIHVSLGIAACIAAAISYFVRIESDTKIHSNFLKEAQKASGQEFQRPRIQTRTYVTIPALLKQNANVKKKKEREFSPKNRIWSDNCVNTAQIDHQIKTIAGLHIHTLTAKHEKNGDQHVYEDCIYGEPKFKPGREPQEQVQ